MSSGGLPLPSPAPIPTPLYLYQVPPEIEEIQEKLAQALGLPAPISPAQGINIIGGILAVPTADQVKMTYDPFSVMLNRGLAKLRLEIDAVTATAYFILRSPRGNILYLSLGNDATSGFIMFNGLVDSALASPRPRGLASPLYNLLYVMSIFVAAATQPMLNFQIVPFDVETALASIALRRSLKDIVASLP